MKKPDIKSESAKRIARTEAYADKVRLLFAKTVNAILTMNKTMPTLDEGVMFSFDAQSIKTQKQVEQLLRQLHSVATMAIRQGIALEWEQANAECDKLVQSCFGKKILESTEFSAWTQRNTKARDAFMNRSDNGLNLSDKIWKDVRQLRDEMEVAMTVAIGEGDSASSMSRKVREYLNDPDLMFRRFRYKDESGEWQRKWKKRIKDPKTGKVKWIDYDRDSYKTGAGVYKSSAKNAMRVARTETNIAYRRADNERWQQMDFVLGQRIQLSKSHPKKDICDKLVGDYPKDFVFDGWHPQCFCFATPILVDESEMAKVTQAFLKGEKYTPKGKRITSYPQGFKDWVTEHADQIEASRSRGTEPYFIKNNTSTIDDILNPQEKLSIAEIAARRHAERTSEKEKQLREFWEKKKAEGDARRKNETLINTTANNVLAAAEKRGFTNFNEIDITSLQEAIKQGNSTLIKQQTQALAKQMATLQKQVKSDANTMIAKASDYGEVDTTALLAAISSSKLSEIKTKTNSLLAQINAVEAQEKAISDLIPDAHAWHKQFSMEALQSVYSAVEAGIKKLAGKSLAEQKKWLEKEIKYVEDPTFLKPHSTYPTWKVAQDAYAKKLEDVIYKMKLETIKSQMAIVETWSSSHPKSLNVANLLADYKTAVASNEDIAIIQSKANLAYSEYQKRLAEQARRDAKKVAKNGGASIKFDADAYSQERKDAAMWAKNTKSADNKLRDKCGEVWRTATEDEKDAIYGYTSSYHNIQESLRGITYYGSESQRQLGEKRIPLIESIINKSSYDFDMWVQRGDTSIALKKFGLSNYNYASDAEIYALLGKEGTEGAYWSAGVAKGKGFDSKPIIFNIYVPRGAKLMYCEPFSAFGNGNGRHWDGKSRQSSFGDESEILIQRGTKFRITKVEKAGGKWYIDVEIISQNPLPFPYVGGYPYL